MDEEGIKRIGRVAALYDIHGNLPALKAVFRDLEDVNVDTIVVGGDVVWGPWPKETVNLLRSRSDVLFIRGNADREVADRLDATDGLPAEAAAVNAWAADQLSEETRAWLLGLPEKMTLSVKGLGAVLFCHGSPRSDEEMITTFSPEERIAPMLQDVSEDIVVCGHTHTQFDLRVGNQRVLNAGSVGLPYEKLPGAYWLLLGDEVHHERTIYDTGAAARAMRETSCPGVDEMFAQTVKRPPDPVETARHFESVAQGDQEQGSG